MRDSRIMTKSPVYPLLAVLLATFAAATAVAQEGAGDLGAPVQPEAQPEAPPQPEAQPETANPEVPGGALVAAETPPTPPSGPSFRGSQMNAAGRVYELGCNAGMHFVHGSIIYVQCAESVVVVDTAAARATTFRVPGMPTNFFVQGGRVWVELNHDTAHPVASLPSLAPQAPPQQPQQRFAPRNPQQFERPPTNTGVGSRGEVVRFNSGEVHIRFHSAPQLYAGTRVAFTGSDMTPVVGTLTARAGDVFLARVSYGQTVPVGATAEVTNAVATGGSTFPPRQSSFRLALTARGLIGAGQDGGGGIIADIDAEWRLRAPVFLRLLFDPIGVGFGDETIGFAGGHFIGGYDSAFLAIGLGIGFQLVETDFVEDFFFDRRLGVGTSLGFLLRVGSPEGFHVELFNAMTYVDKFRFGSLRFRVQWGLGHRNWMVIRGGGGITRAAYGEVGFRRLLNGWSGDEGALFLTASFGGSAIYTNLDRNEIYAGPTFGVSIEKIW